MSAAFPEDSLMVSEAHAEFAQSPPIVVDATAVCAILFDEDTAGELSRRLEGHTLCAPHLLDHEVVGAAIRRFPAQGAAAGMAQTLKRYRALEIVLCDTDVLAQFELALRYGLTAPGAAYLSLAAQLNSPVATFDPQLTEAARAHLSSPG